MTLHIHLRIVGILLMLLGLSHIFFNRFFRWEQELVAVSLLTGQVFFVHNFFIGLTVMLGGAASFFSSRYPESRGSRRHGDVLVVPIVSPVRRLRLSNMARRSVSHLHALGVFLSVVLRYGDIWDCALKCEELTDHLSHRSRRYANDYSNLLSKRSTSTVSDLQNTWPASQV